ncbi:MAG TPA: hypothetical protein VLQ90_15610 [Pyrinomonadaceae bacterium]|nr:hypothetical protein [Pyrinomonadaceae bacterium]
MAEKRCNALLETRASASGYLLKKTPPARLLESLRETVQGRANVTGNCASRSSTFPRNSSARSR